MRSVLRIVTEARLSTRRNTEFQIYDVTQVQHRAATSSRVSGVFKIVETR